MSCKYTKNIQITHNYSKKTIHPPPPSATSPHLAFPFFCHYKKKMYLCKVITYLQSHEKDSFTVVSRLHMSAGERPDPDSTPQIRRGRRLVCQPHLPHQPHSLLQRRRTHEPRYRICRCRRGQQPALQPPLRPHDWPRQRTLQQPRSAKPAQLPHRRRFPTYRRQLRHQGLRHPSDEKSLP